MKLSIYRDRFGNIDKSIKVGKENEDEEEEEKSGERKDNGLEEKLRQESIVEKEKEGAIVEDNIGDNEGYVFDDLEICELLFNSLFAGQRHRDMEKIDTGLQELEDLLAKQPEFSLKYHFLECFFRDYSTSFLYSSLYTALHSLPFPSLPLPFMKHILNMLKETKRQFFSNFHNPERFMIAFHYLMKLITFFPLGKGEGSHNLHYAHYLMELRKVVDEFRLLPIPYGMIAEEFMQVLESEIRCPRSCLLKKLREEFPPIDIYTANINEMRYTETYTGILISDFSSNSNIFMEAQFLEHYPSMNMPQYKHELTHILRKRFVLSTFRMFTEYILYIDAFGLMTEEAEATLGTIGPNGYFNIYAKILEIMDQTDGIYNIYIYIYVIYLDLAMEMAPELMGRGLEALLKNLQPEAKKHTVDELIHSQQFELFYPDIPLMCMDMSQESFGKSLLYLFRKSHNTKFMNEAVPLKLIIGGTDATLHHFTQSYGSIYMAQNSEEVKAVNMEELDLRIYILPLQYNTLAQYIATYDDIYCTQVWAPFSIDPLLPKLSHYEARYKGLFTKLRGPKYRNKMNPAIKMPSIIAKDRQLQIYLREALRFFRIPIFKVELSKNRNLSRIHTVLYFVARVEIGFFSTYAKTPYPNTFLGPHGTPIYIYIYIYIYRPNR